MNNGEIWQGELSDYWMEDGILFGVSKKNPRTLERLRKDFVLVRKITDNKKINFILDNTNTTGYDIPTLKYSLIEIPKVYKAVALVSRSSTGMMISTIFSQLYSSDTLPVQIFEHVDQAKQWIKEQERGLNYSFSAFT